MALQQDTKLDLSAENGVRLPYCASSFDLRQTLDCGQAFRWREENGGFFGIVRKKICNISPIDNSTLLCTASRADFEAVWHDYFDLSRDYECVKQILCADPVLARAIAHAPGLRLLRQEPWEALCSFIISQNNNIPRIKGIVARLCELLGEPLGDGLFAFPEPAKLASCSVDDLAPLRAGFRARYLLDAARRVSEGEVVLETVALLPLEEARAQLCRITGVGTKVADCTLLYGCARIDCVPVDVWIARVLERLYPGGLPDFVLPFAGIAQQYLFHYARTCPGAFDSE